MCFVVRITRLVSQKKLAAALANGTCFTSTLEDDDTLQLKTEWKETRFVASDKFIGMSINKKSYALTYLLLYYIDTIHAALSTPAHQAECSVERPSLRQHRKTHQAAQTHLLVLFPADSATGVCQKVEKRSHMVAMKSTSQSGIPNALSNLKRKEAQTTRQRPLKSGREMTSFLLRYGGLAMYVVSLYIWRALSLCSTIAFQRRPESTPANSHNGLDLPIFRLKFWQRPHGRDSVWRHPAI